MIIENNILTVEISPFGAEVKSIVKDKVEYLWQADSKYWKRSSPVLFPIVGRLIDDEYIYKGKTYSLGQHGFARDNEFNLVSSCVDECVFSFHEDEVTLEKYPFKFNLYIKYKLEKNTLIVSWVVENTNNEDMYFQIGAHPAFNFLNGSRIDLNTVTNKYELGVKPQIHRIVPNVKVDSIEVTNDIFLQDAIVFDHIEKVVLRDNEKSVTIECPEFPFLGIWSKTTNGINAPFICVEPWHGITDFSSHNKQLQEKIGINQLKPSCKFEASYKIIIK